MSIRPAIGRSRPIKYRNKVLLPLPEPPRMANVVPRSTWKLTCSMSTRDPQPIRRSLTMMCGLAANMSDPQDCKEECKQGIDDNHAKDCQYHSRRGAGAD